MRTGRIRQSGPAKDCNACSSRHLVITMIRPSLSCMGRNTSMPRNPSATAARSKRRVLAISTTVHLPGPDFELQQPDDHVPTSYVTTSLPRLVAAGKVAMGARRIG
jgi:hypothetical protein